MGQKVKQNVHFSKIWFLFWLVHNSKQTRMYTLSSNMNFNFCLTEWKKGINTMLHCCLVLILHRTFLSVIDVHWETEWMLQECFPAALDVCLMHLPELLIRSQMVKHFVFCLCEWNALLSKCTVCVLLSHYSSSFCSSLFLFSFSPNTFVSTFQSLLLLDITVFTSFHCQSSYFLIVLASLS